MAVDDKIITITITKAFSDSIQANRALFGYQDTVDDGQGNQIPNPQDVNIYMVEQLITQLRNKIESNARSQAYEQADIQIQQQLDQVFTNDSVQIDVQ